MHARYQVLSGGLVESVIIIEPSAVAAYESATGLTLRPETEGNAAADRVATPGPVPAEVTRWQFRKELLARGILPSQISAALQAIADPLERESALTDWECAEHVERANPLIAQLAPAFGLSEAAVDGIFRAAALL